MSRFCLITLLLVILWSNATAAAASAPGLATFLKGTSESQDTSTKAADNEEPTEHPAEAPIAGKREALEAQIRVAQQTLRDSNEDETTSSSADAQLVELLTQLDLAYAQQQSATTRKQTLEKARDEAKAELQLLHENGPSEEKPYSFFLHERLQDMLVTHQERLKAYAVTISSVSQSLDRAKATFENKEKNRRQAKERSTASSNPAEAASLAAALRLAQQESKLASAKLDGVQLELANVKLEEETLQLQIQQLTEKLSIISQEVSFSIEDLNEKLRELSRATSKIVRKQEENEAEVTIRMSGWKNAQQRLDNAPEPSAAMQAELEARRWAYHLRKNRADFLARQNQWLQTLREVWRRRYNVATEQFETAQLVEWGAAAVTFSEELATEKTIQLARVEDLRKILAETERVVAQDGLPEVERWLGEQANVIREQIEFLNNHISNLEVAERTNQKLIQEIRSRTSSFSVAEWGRLIWSKIGLVWDYELMKTEDDQPLRVSAVVTGLLLLILGYRVSKWASSTLGNRVLTHFGINEGGAAALQSLSFYALLFTSTLMALKVVSVPLTLFTFLGGAAAIGLGFGSQNILNNFISGLILLTEQPIRVGDLIELNGLTGCVESIGMRSTRVRTGSNCEIIVPNSSFLENNVVNWTLADSVVRCEVRVGVSYGSPTRDVARWLKYAAVEHGLVLKKPEPFVWFAGFGDNSLDFELYFFITVRTLSERRRIESDLRFMVDQYFREAGICIAFPQRDIHLDTQKPLEVRMLPAENDATQQTGHSARDGQQAA